VRTHGHRFVLIVAACWWLCAPVSAQEQPFASASAEQPITPVMDGVDDSNPSVVPEVGTPQSVPGSVPVFQADTANLEGCQVIARFDNHIVLACEILWKVNQRLEMYQANAPEDKKVAPDQLAEVRGQLMRMELGQMVDRKLLYEEFRRNVPPENLPRVEQSLLQPFEEREIPELMTDLKVNNQQDLEQELARLGSSLADVRRTFNEKVIAGEWARSKVKINEEVSPDEMLEYYRANLSKYEFPTQARWEELSVNKSRFADEREAYAALAQMGNEAWHRGVQAQVMGPAFAEVAKTKSDGVTASKGGVYDWTTKGALQCAEIDQSLFTLQVGQMSPIIDSGPAYHIVRVLERREAGRRPFTDVQVEIREALKEERMRAELEVYLSKLRRDARVWTVFTGNTTADVLMGKRPDETQMR
jgi:parvulin-like peptidyl-prolyl isomerase